MARVFFLILSLLISTSTALWCLDGSDCMEDCNVCEGGACLRIQGSHPSRSLSIAMTCLPHDSLVHLLHPEGCRTDLSTGKKTCLCSQHDFCNSSRDTKYNTLATVLALIVLFN